MYICCLCIELFQIQILCVAQFLLFLPLVGGPWKYASGIVECSVDNNQYWTDSSILSVTQPQLIFIFT